MKMPVISKLRPLLLSERTVVLLLTAVLILASVASPSCMTVVEGSFIRTAIGIRGGLNPAPEIVIVGIDNRSIREMGAWPWPARNFSQLIERLSEIQTNLISIDSQIVEESDITPALLAKRKTEETSIVLGYDFYPDLADLPPDEKEEPKRGDRRPIKSLLDKICLPSRPTDVSKIPAMADIKLIDMPSSLQNRISEGYANIISTTGGAVVDYPLAVRFQERLFPSFPVAIYSKWRGFTPIVTEDTNGSPTGMGIGSEQIRTEPDLGITISFRGPAGTFPKISASDIIEGRTSADKITGRIILLGLTAEGEGKSYDTVVGQMDTIEIFANVLDNLLYNRALTPWLAWRFMIFFLVALGLGFAFGILRLPQMKRLIAILILIPSFWIAGLLLFWIGDIWFPVIQLSSATAAIALGLIVWRVFVKELPHHRLVGKYGWRMSASAIEDIANNPSLIKREGRACDVTVLALDIKGFGSITDKLSPRELIEFVRGYRLLVSDTLIRHGAMIESWTGDDCRAVFGAPKALTEHTLRACMAALELKRLISSHQGIWNERFGIDRVHISIGIQRGKAIAGDFGLGYDIMGGAMEAATQLRTQNRLYRTWALVGDAVYLETQIAMAYRSLDPVYLWGEKAPTLIHEFIGEVGTILPAMRGYEDARKAYLEGQFEKAARLFKEILNSNPHDGPSRLFYKRATALQRKPPDLWNGVWK